ncbi:syntaxin-5 [Parasteatoda tepidariorum]|uniref:syntaxin-5 n=1 Tax=Parasteatoda tepidariorum TaxID=114398 RepID=UPI00077F9A6A|nr:syntaxin-5 [Parasteatoda tepidariorum]XP_015927615.1 syntaxin-5 [Parasteatoda tepidariorum]
MSTLRRRTNSDREKDFQLDFSQNICEVSPINTHQSLLKIEMTCRDRTGEFCSIIKNKEGRMRENGFQPSSKRGRSFKGSSEWNHFMQVAKQIGKDISSTFTKLEKLTLLAKKKTLFDDRPLEIQELTYIIKQDINNLNKQIAQLQEVSKGRNYNNGKHMQSHSNSVVIALQSKLASMSNDFKEVLEVRTENLKHQKNRRDQFTEGGVSATLPASAISGHSGSVLLSDDHASRGDVSINMGSAQDHFQQQMQLIDEQDSYIQSRADTMQNIEATIVELGSIFQQLAHMVKEQEEQVMRIDSNVEQSYLNVEAAHSEILKYFESVTSNRWLMLKIFAVLIIFFIIFVVFLA